MERIERPIEERERKTYGDAVCEWCKKDFEKLTPGQLVCGPECQKSRSRVLNRAKQEAERKFKLPTYLRKLEREKQRRRKDPEKIRAYWIKKSAENRERRKSA